MLFRSFLLLVRPPRTSRRRKRRAVRCLGSRRKECVDKRAMRRRGADRPVLMALIIASADSQSPSTALGLGSPAPKIWASTARAKRRRSAVGKPGARTSASSRRVARAGGADLRSRARSTTSSQAPAARSGPDPRARRRRRSALSIRIVTTGATSASKPPDYGQDEAQIDAGVPVVRGVPVPVVVGGRQLRRVLEGQRRLEHARLGVGDLLGVDWTSANMGGWKDTLQSHAIQPIQQFRYTVGKNATDSAMIIDAMDIFYSGTVDAFCLVSSDSDYTRVADRKSVV